VFCFAVANLFFDFSQLFLMFFIFF
jgi:hypothetical protein